jgi:hypothetical protein
MIWLDRGTVIVDDEPDVVVSSYEDSIRRQEERRLRLKRLSSVSMPASPVRSLPMIIEVRGRDRGPLPCPLFISRFSLAIDGTAIDSLPIGLPTSSTALIVEDGTAWGGSVEWQGRTARTWKNFGSVFHKIAGQFEVAGLIDPAAAPAFGVEIDCWGESPCDLSVQAFVDDREFDLGDFTTSHGWQTIAAISQVVKRPGSSKPGRTLSLGSGAIVIASMCAVDDAGAVKSIFRRGEPFTLKIEYEINQPDFKEEVQLLASFHRDGVHDTCRVFCPGLVLDSMRSERGELHMRFPHMSLGAGSYTVSFGIAERGYFDREQVLFYSINPGMYACISRGLTIEVVDRGIVGTGTGAVIEAEWRVTGASADLEHVRSSRD